ncbi:rab effector Noc2 [Galendromus occidentalis]|uniref:Rab effector Noc2 n=1 Tax=Galendromus occidentalis TaxID=34638 RepID=A0AAJ6QPK8_9ACAR|nr:rab effector Noc2 [Galendromus occidentalis]
MNTWKTRVTWACPDDRELALRAKLRSGWSAKSDRVFQKQEPLSTQEVSTIVEVVKKADRVEQMERDRVSRLVKQLDKLRNRCVQGQKSKRTCNMCGVGFRLLISSAQKCRICEKDVCAKCGLNAVVLQSGLNQRDAVWLCKICHEIREVWKKSGAWFYKGMPLHNEERKVGGDAPGEQKTD